ncbi:hypothetical protein ACIBF1_44220 [Spirillospora sp. NPDC050679]
MDDRTWQEVAAVTSLVESAEMWETAADDLLGDAEAKLGPDPTAAELAALATCAAIRAQTARIELLTSEITALRDARTNTRTDAHADDDVVDAGEVDVVGRGAERPVPRPARRARGRHLAVARSVRAEPLR